MQWAVSRRRSRRLGLPEDLVDLTDPVEQLLGHLRVARVLRLTGELGGPPEQLVEIRVRLEVLRLEVVGPQHPQVVLHEVGALLLDQQGAGAEVGIVVPLHLLDDLGDGLGLDAGLRRVVDAAGQVAVGGCTLDPERALGGLQQMGEDSHRVSFVVFVRGDTRVRFLVVDGDSMRPAIEPGDRLLVLRLRPRVGDVVALRDPRERTRVIVKRVAAIDATGVDVRGDNAAASTDSRAFGRIDARDVLGRAVYRYAPSTRAGRVRRYR